MLRPLQLIPWGLGNLLGLKGDEGILNEGWQQNLQPSMEMLEFLAGKNALETITQVVGVNAVGSAVFSSLVVPSGENWLVRGIGCTALPGGAELIRYTINTYSSQAVNIREVTAEFASSLTDAAGVGAAGGAMNVGAFLLYGGDAIRPFVRRITTAGSINITIAATIYRFAG